MKKFFKKYSILAFWGSIIIMASAIEANHFIIAIVALCIFIYTCKINKFIELEKKSKQSNL